MTGDGLGRGLSDMWRSVLLFIPTALAFAAILLVGWLVARLLRAAVSRGLHKTGLDRVVERGAAAKAFARVSPSVLAGKLTFYGVLLFALQLAFGLWGANPVSDLLTRLIAWLPRLVVAIVLVVVATAIARAVQDLIAGALGGLSYGRLVARAASVVIVVLGVIAALDQVRIATSITGPVLIAVLATIAGVLIVGVGGGLIRPMQQRWESWLERAAEESSAIRDHARAYAADRDRARAAEPDRAYSYAGDRDPEPHGARLATATSGADSAATQIISGGADDFDDVAADETQVIPPPRQAGKSHADESRADSGRSDESRADNSRSDESRADNGRSDQSRADNGRSDQSRADDGRSDEVRADKRRADESRADEGRAGPGRAEESRGDGTGEQATVITSAAGDTTIINPGPNDTVVIGSGTEDAESTQVIPPAHHSDERK